MPLRWVLFLAALWIHPYGIFHSKLNSITELKKQAQALKTKRCFKKKLKKYLAEKSIEVFDYIKEYGFRNYEIPFQIVLTEALTQQEWITS